jgi:flavin reductase (DIM6/NTAB) family NADH-FMN oxidoreductase RutF
MQTIDCDTLSADTRRVMRHVGSTVTIVSTESGKPFGMVATAMMSLSLEPPALVVGINQSASICGPLLERKAFCVNILTRHDEDISRRFTSLNGSHRFSAGDWRSESSGPFRGIPYLFTAQAALFCMLQQSAESGTHCLIVGSIKRVIDREIDDPLLYCDGRYGQFTETGPDPRVALDDRLALCS